MNYQTFSDHKNLVRCHKKAIMFVSANLPLFSRFGGPLSKFNSVDCGHENTSEFLEISHYFCNFSYLGCHSSPNISVIERTNSFSRKESRRASFHNHETKYQASPSEPNNKFWSSTLARRVQGCSSAQFRSNLLDGKHRLLFKFSSDNKFAKQCLSQWK